MSTRFVLLGVLSVLVLLAAAAARPADLDLDDDEDARRVDEAYERLFGPGGSEESMRLDDYDGELPQGDMPVNEDVVEDQPQALPSGGADGPVTNPDQDMVVGRKPFKLTDLVRGPGMPQDARPDDALLEELNLTLSSLHNSSLPHRKHGAAANSTGGQAGHAGEAAPSPAPAPSQTGAHKFERESLENAFVERNKEMRLDSIKAQILSYIGIPDGQSFLNTSTATQQLEVMRNMVERVNLLHWPGTDVFTEKVHSHYPSCAAPRNTDEELWTEGPQSGAMNLLFDITYPTPASGATVNIVQAKLRLFKISQSNLTSPLPPSCATGTPGDAGLNPLQAVFASPSSAEDRLVRVSVYWYTRSLKKNRMKRKLLDSRMMSVYGSEWTEWNVRPAVKVWRESGRNFGLAVEVEDEDGSIQPAQSFFSGMNCTQEASTARPVPSFLLDAARAILQDDASAAVSSSSSSSQPPNPPHAFNQDLFPMIELCTVEVANEDANAAVHRSQQQQQLSRPHPRPHPQHRHRHPHIHPHIPHLPHVDPGRKRAPRGQFDPRQFIIPQRIIMSAAQHRSLVEAQRR